MDRDFFINAGFPPPQHLDSTMAMPFIGLNCVPEQSYLEPNSSVDQYTQFESALMNSGMSNDAFALRELIGKLGGAGNFPPSSSTAMAANPYDSRHGTPLSSLPQLHLSILDHVSNSNLGNSVPLASISADPGFAERAAKFSCFGSRSFNGRRAPIGLNNGESRNRSVSPLMGNGKLPRVSSSPVLSQPQIEIRGNHGVLSGPEKKLSKLLGSGANSNEGSSVSEQITKTSNELNSRKRKGVSRGNPKEDVSNSAKEAGGDEDANAKRLKATENESVAKTEEEQHKEGSNEKPIEPIKDYIHVRARRGQATDSHSLAERVRREKIGERMKLLQDLVPGCNKVTGKALMLDEIINYVQSLQRQVEFLSMKLATVNPELDFDIVDTLPKDQKGSVVPQELYPLESSAAAAAAFYNHNHQSRQNVQQLHNSNFAIQLPSLDGFSASLPEFPSFCEDDLHSIVQMGFTQNTVNFPVPYQLSDMKAER